VDFDNSHVKIAKPTSGKIETKESGVLGHLRAAIDGFETPITLLFPHSKDLQLVKPFSAVINCSFCARDFPKNAENPTRTNSGSLQYLVCLT